jgi:hypothetical protein
VALSNAHTFGVWREDPKDANPETTGTSANGALGRTMAISILANAFVTDEPPNRVAAFKITAWDSSALGYAAPHSCSVAALAAILACS